MTGILFVHSNFPAQFGSLAEELQRRGERCLALASSTGRSVAAVRVVPWRIERGSTPGIFPAATRAEANLIRGRAAAESALQLKREGFSPDLIIGHPGWGETLFLNEVFPSAKQIAYAEYYYHAQGAAVGFDPEFGSPDLDERIRVRAKNATLALAYAEADRIVCPSAFQCSLLPDTLRSRASVVHEGVDTERIKRDPSARLHLANGRVLDSSIPVVTFINRRFEPLRGFHILMRALPKLLASVPNVEVVFIGADEAGGYGQDAPKGTTWKQHYLEQLKDELDLSRVHFTGRLPYDKMLAAIPSRKRVAGSRRVQRSPIQRTRCRT